MIRYPVPDQDRARNSIAGALAFVLALAFSGRVRPRVDVFLDKCCIHQVDEELKGHGIRAIPEVLRRSDSLLLVYTEDYFRRLDERLSRSDDGPADVPRFGAGELDDFLAAATRRRSPAYEECAICLNDFDDDEDVCVLPCAAAHQFKRGCARAWLEKNTHCPLCRVDILPIHRATATQAPAAPPSPRALGFTRDGGTISRWEPAPPPDVPRPDYVPAHLRDAAGYVEVQYPDQGVARVWRVPQGSNQRPP